MLEYCIHLRCCIFRSYNVEIETKQAYVVPPWTRVRMCDCPVSTTLRSCFLLVALDHIYKRQQCDFSWSVGSAAYFPSFPLTVPPGSWAHTSFTRRGVDERGERQEKLGHSARGRLLSFICLLLTLHICLNLFPLSSTCSRFQFCCVACVCATHRVCFQRGASRERWPSRRRDVASCCHWALLQLICSLIASLAFVLFLTQWPSTKETLSQSAVCVCCVGVRFIVKHHVVQLVTVNIDDCYWRCSVNQTRPWMFWMLTF